MFFNEPIMVAPPIDSVVALASTATVPSQFSTRDQQAFPADSQSPAFTYQWYKWSGSDWLSLPGQTDADLHLVSAQAGDSGFYLLRASNSAGYHSSESIELSVVSPSYLTWVSSFPGLPLEERNPGDDFDGDSLSNWFEYATEQNPLFTATPPSVEISNEAGLLTLSYVRVRSDVTYIVQTSTDMENWTTAGVNQGSTGLGPVEATIPVAPGEVRFLRLVVD